MTRKLPFGTLLMVVAQMAMAGGPLTATHPWVREAPPNAMMLAGYVELHNGSDQRVTIVGAHSDAFCSVEIHRTVTRDGMASMEHMPELTVEPGKSLALAPGGLHMMLMRPQEKISLGRSITITLEFSGGLEQSLEFVVASQVPSH